MNPITLLSAAPAPVYYLAQDTLDLTKVSANDAPQIDINFGGLEPIMSKIGIAIGLIWFFFFILKLAFPGGQGGGALGGMAQKIGGWGGLIIAFILVLALIQPDVVIAIINMLIKIGYFVWGLFASAFNF